MAEWAQQRKDAKSQVVALDVKALMAEAMKDGFDSYMTAVVVPCLILGVDWSLSLLSHVCIISIHQVQAWAKTAMPADAVGAKAQVRTPDDIKSGLQSNARVQSGGSLAQLALEIRALWLG